MVRTTREINASGEVIKFNTEVITVDGNVENRDVVRIGNFNVVSDGQYLTYSPSRGTYSELPSQPAGRYTSQTSDILMADLSRYSLLLILLDLRVVHCLQV